MRANTKLLHLETPTNPMMTLCDIRCVADRARTRRARRRGQHVASPYLQRPLELGADFAVHSTTKFLNGHSRFGRRRRGGEKPGAPRVARLRAEQLRGDPFSVRLVARPSRDQDARCPDGATRDERPGDREITCRSTRRCERPTTPGFPITRSTTSLRRQMKGFGAMISFTSAPSRRPGAARPVCASARSARVSGASRP